VEKLSDLLTAEKKIANELCIKDATASKIECKCFMVVFAFI
jgi:hypothetical protein